jgi:hypothetical protein
VSSYQAGIPLAIRWTIGDVSARGFEALRLSAWGAWRVFGPSASYVVCVNSITVDEARRRAGPVPEGICWLQVTRQDIPAFLVPLLARNMSAGSGWKFAPLRVFPDRAEISLDNDVILWEMPQSISAWIASAQDECLLSEDVRAAYGQLASLAPAKPALNSGIRGLPAGFDFESALRTTIAARERELGARLVLASGIDEQGLQAAALVWSRRLHVVSLAEVSVCSPFHPHLPHLGRCGAHFVGVNARHFAWDYFGRPADAWMAEHWERHAAELHARTQAEPFTSTPAAVPIPNGTASPQPAAWCRG